MGHESATIFASVTPSPFGVGDTAEVTVAVRDGHVVLTDGNRTVAVRPARAVMGHGTLTLSVPGAFRRFTLTFLRHDVAALARQRYEHLQPLYGELAALGLRDLLVALRDAGVAVTTAPRLRHGAGGHRANAWVGGFTFVFVELALFGIPASMVNTLVSGDYQTPSAVVTGILAAAFAGFCFLAVVMSPVPDLIRRLSAHGDTRDPVRYLDTWSGRPPDAAVPEPGHRFVFVPGRPVARTVLLALACALYAFPLHLMLFSGSLVAAMRRLPEPPARPARQLPPPPGWLDGDVVTLVGYAGSVVALAVFAVGLVRWRRDPAAHGVRWAPLVGAVLALGFGQTGRDMGADNVLQASMPIVIVVMIVAFTCGRLMVGFGVFGAMAVFVTLTTIVGTAPESVRLPVLLALSTMFVLLAAIAARYFPSRAAPVSLPHARARQVRRTVWSLWGVTVALGIALAIAAPLLMGT